MYRAAGGRGRDGPHQPFEEMVGPTGEVFHPELHALPELHARSSPLSDERASATDRHRSLRLNRQEQRHAMLERAVHVNDRFVAPGGAALPYSASVSF